MHPATNQQLIAQYATIPPITLQAAVARRLSRPDAGLLRWFHTRLVAGSHCFIVPEPPYELIGQFFCPNSEVRLSAAYLLLAVLHDEELLALGLPKTLKGLLLSFEAVLGPGLIGVGPDNVVVVKPTHKLRRGFATRALGYPTYAWE